MGAIDPAVFGRAQLGVSVLTTHPLGLARLSSVIHHKNANGKDRLEFVDIIFRVV